MMWNLKTWALALTAIAISLVGSAWYGHNSGRQSGMREVQTLWDSERAATAQAQAEELMKARQREQSLQDLATKLRLEKRREADRLAREYAAALDGLRDRPDAPAGDAGLSAPAGTEPTAGWCTGARLYGDHAAAFAGEAARAAELQALLRECRAGYAEAERQLNTR